ncbi:hypothetical protein EV213_12822 [Aureibacillus halotolerans]|uniref:Uncharacterized protein n=1 Tax=Aureibacillus halotolerans TaxID=1508390 RepID=A0A4R6TSF0_9BACI|nr:hypothetical protein EV213_12822 [Aureibacillus halotolerans]
MDIFGELNDNMALVTIFTGMAIIGSTLLG